jgi:hypothetical protein
MTKPDKGTPKIKQLWTNFLDAKLLNNILMKWIQQHIKKLPCNAGVGLITDMHE